MSGANVVDSGISTDPGQRLTLGSDELPYFGPECEDVTEQFVSGATANPGGATPSGILLTEITVNKEQDITVVHTGSGFTGGAGSGWGIADAPMFATANSIAAANVFSSTGDRIDSATPSKTYTASLTPGTYYIGVWSGGLSGVTSHTLDISYCKPLAVDYNDWIKEECYEEQINVALNVNGNTRNVGPSMAGLNLYHIVSATPPAGGQQANFITRISGALDGSGNYSGIVTNTTTGQSVTTNTNNWSGASTALSVQAFNFDEPLSVSPGDLIRFEAVGTGNARWRGNFTGTDSGIYINPNGTGTINAAVDAVYSGYYSNNYIVRTYADGSLKLVDKTANTLTDLASIDPSWTPCVEMDSDNDVRFVESRCYQEPGASIELSNAAYIDEINPAQLATLPSGAHMRWTAPTETVLNSLEIHGFGGGVATISWSTSNGLSSSGSVTFDGSNPETLSLGDITLENADTIDFTLDSLTVGQMQLSPSAASSANGWTALQDYSGFASSSHWSSSLNTSTPFIDHKVNVYEDSNGATVYAEVNDEDLTDLASIPNNWTPCPTSFVSSEEGNISILGDDGNIYGLPLKQTTCYREIVDTPIPGSEFTLDNTTGGPSNAGVTFGTSQIFHAPDRRIFFDTSVLPFGARIKSVSMYEERRGNNTASVFMRYDGIPTNLVSPALHGNGFSATPSTATFATSLLIDDATPLILVDPSQNHWDYAQGAGADFIASITPGTATASGGANDGVTTSLTGFNATVEFELSEVNEYTVREYSDGETSKLIYFNSTGEPVEIASIPSNWEVVNCLQDEDEARIQEMINASVPKVFEGGSRNGMGTSIWTRGATLVRDATGRWTVTFDTNHKDNSDYHISLTVSEDTVSRDGLDIQEVTGSKDANGFSVMITTGDNGTDADTLIDAPWTFRVVESS